MQNLAALEPKNVLKYFYEICEIPHGSYNMSKIADYCEDFAKKLGLKSLRDEANNVIIFKNGTKGNENAEPIILQGHLDMVCAKDEDSQIDFMRDGLTLTAEGDFLKADGTTLGADNGIAVAIIFSILESDTIPHPPIEAVLTTDEEVGMIGAMALDTTPLTAKRMINIDSEEDDTVTVSCAGGSDFIVKMPIRRQSVGANKVTLKIKGLLGGHSGVEIDKDRVNAAKLCAKVIDTIKMEDFWIIDISSGEKGNAIPNSCYLELCAKNAKTLSLALENCLEKIKSEIVGIEPDFAYEIMADENESVHSVLSNDDFENLLHTSCATPNGVQKMSDEIKGLVETSLNLGVLKTESDYLFMHISLRSNKEAELLALENELKSILSTTPCEINTFGHYPAWEYKANSKLQEIYIDCYKKQYDNEPKVAAIHAGLECGVFASKIKDLDCISLGPNLFDVHTPKEKLSLSSLESTYKLILSILENCK